MVLQVRTNNKTKTSNITSPSAPQQVVETEKRVISERRKGYDK